MANEGLVVYQFGAIESLSQAISQFVTQMNETLAGVDREFQGLLAQGWQGKGANAFHGASQQWHRQADAMAATLHQLSAKVGTASVNMAQADSAAAARF